VEGKKIFLLFHIAVPLILVEVPYIKSNFRINRWALIIGSLFPDIVDKTLAFLNLGFGRGISHSLLMMGLSFFLLFLITKGNKAISYPFLMGFIAHLVLDLPHIPLFYPFISYDFIYLEDPIGFWLETLFTNPVIYITEIIGAILLLYIMIHNKLYKISDIFEYLKTSPQFQIDKLTR